MAFDIEKNYAEFGNAFFRGRLKGATGTARFKLTARSINAVDTVNIRGQAVTWNFFSRYENFVGAPGQSSWTYLSMDIDVLDDGVFIEFICYAQTPMNEAAFNDYEPAIFVDNILRPSYAARNGRSKAFPFNEVLPLAKGVHTVRIAGQVQTSAEGYIFCRYIRPTGSASL